jgi:catechol 2,3-dioxygenase-like lactoylglutathione lyase family enzyme
MPIDRREVLLLLASASGSAIAGDNRAASQADHISNSQTVEGAPTEKVLGIGGFFFRSKNPKFLSRWYLEHLGINLTPSSYDMLPWQTEAGITVFAPFPQESDYFGPDAQKKWMINFRVRDMDKMAAQLQSKGIAVKIDPMDYPNGRFARLYDPEGNPIELWQPKNPSAT